MKVGLSIGGGVRVFEEIDPRALAEDGFASVFVALYEREMLWHAQRAAEFTRACQAAGLQVYAVPLGYGKVMDPDPAIDSLYVREQPQACQVDNRGRRCAKACPNNPAFLEWFSSNMRTLAWLVECRGFLWDEPSFYYARGNWACRCQYCQRLYFARHQQAMPTELTDLVVAFRRNSMLMFLLAAAAAIQAVDRRLVTAVMPSAALGSREAGLGADDWGGLPASAAVDLLSAYASWEPGGPQVETAIRTTYQSLAAAARRHGKGTLLWVAGSPNPRDKLLDCLRLAHHVGVEHLVVVGHQSLVAAPGYDRFRAALAKVLSQLR